MPATRKGQLGNPDGLHTEYAEAWGFTHGSKNIDSFDFSPALTHHGGGCCGVKHLWNLGSPGSIIGPLKLSNLSNTRPNGYFISPGIDQGLFYSYQTPAITGKFPKQTRAERVSDMLAKLSSKHTDLKQYLVEVTLNVVNQKGWIKILESMGFKRQEQFKNRNTLDTIQRLSLLTSEFKPLEKPKKEK